MKKTVTQAAPIPKGIDTRGPKADIANVVIRHINNHTHIRSIEEEPAVREWRTHHIKI